MSLYLEYLQEIEDRKGEGLHPKPIDSADLLSEVIAQIKDTGNEHRAESLNFFIYNTIPGTTSAADAKAAFLKDIILGKEAVEEITPDFAFELLSHMKGGPSIKVLLDLVLDQKDINIAKQAADVLKTQVFLYEADTERLQAAYNKGCPISKEILESYAQAEFFTKLPEIDEEIEVVTYIAAEGDISTDLLSPGNQAHSRSDRELHGKCMITPEAQAEIQALQAKHPNAKVMLIAEKGTMGVGSSRMSGVNNVALWAGKQASPYIPFVNIAPVVAGTNGISPIFLTTVGVTGGIGLDLKNWVKKTDAEGKVVTDANGDPVLEEAYSVATGTVLTINTKEKKLYNGDKELVDVSSAFTPQSVEFMKAGGSYAIVFGKKLQTFAAETLGVKAPLVFAPAKEMSIEGQGLTAVEKIFNKNAVGVASETPLHAGSDVRVKVNIVGSQDTTGLMTSQELESMAATVISPSVDGAYQSGCHTASVWDKKAQANIPKLMSFMNKFGLITARDPKGVYPPMTDVIHKVLNDITVDDQAIIIGGDSHTRMSKGVAFGADSGTVALALATGEATMPIPQSVKVTFKGEMKSHMDFRDVVHATQAQMLKQFSGENVFQGRVIEVHIGTLLADQAFTFTDWTAEMKAKASICISQDDTLIQSLELAKSRIQIMINKGMDNEAKTLQGLIDLADKRIAGIQSGEQPALAPDDSAKYYAEVVVDLDEISEPMIADPDVNNDDVSKRYTHDVIRPVSFYKGKTVDLGFVGSCMVHKGDMQIIAQMLRNIEKQNGSIEFKAPLVVAPPTYNIVDELKAEGDWEVLAKYAGFEFDDAKPKSEARTKYQNILYLERPGCNLCMGNQEKAEPGDTVIATSTRLFQGRVVADTAEKKGESLLGSTPLVVLSTILGRFPTIEEYTAAVEGINLTDFAPPAEEMTVASELIPTANV
ncbi:bifunctional aconitate hydratase 2/2-methylisocitrate dehydratase [Marinomonas sp. C2222]|uniref:Bifunctional aconitate hydratase 2/2-methylisocitrate dehydratase n=1 Tax=Marinomonas sargassi TaxID=2984494 RepID=A0ABT2YS17_9GAMM|nr:bifunctional aconitate hydratase 2/2-methylisocitrate dehydratase [Marinomonas sargassi]MCV2402687.1 bifunctional aconitate hydratase 2/2-methylisocitrate dehydratase [Marinomonas sargassi]